MWGGVGWGGGEKCEVGRGGEKCEVGWGGGGKCGMGVLTTITTYFWPLSWRLSTRLGSSRYLSKS